MVLKENIGSDRSWVYSTLSDVSDGVPTPETLAIRFGNSDSTPPKFSYTPPLILQMQTCSNSISNMPKTKTPRFLVNHNRQQARYLGGAWPPFVPFLFTFVFLFIF